MKQNDVLREIDTNVMERGAAAEECLLAVALFFQVVK
jgi:hypothetical protein